jgi:hypothetical protein
VRKKDRNVVRRPRDEASYRPVDLDDDGRVEAVDSAVRDGEPIDVRPALPRPAYPVSKTDPYVKEVVGYRHERAQVRHRILDASRSELDMGRWLDYPAFTDRALVLVEIGEEFVQWCGTAKEEAPRFVEAREELGHADQARLM